MSRMRTAHFALAATIAACLLGLAVMPSLAQPNAAPVVDPSAVERAIADLEDAQLKAARIDTRLEEARQELYRVLDEEQEAHDRLDSRARLMYRWGGGSFVQVLLGAETFQDFAVRWELLMRMSEQDAADLRTLEAAREEAQQAARSLMAAQAEQARAVDEAEQQAAAARRDLAASETALAEYEARAAELADQERSTPTDSVPQSSGSGPWQTAVASHYALDFTGRGASGEMIGPYSMMVSHRTLPFGTLVEFEYQGKRAVASVEDRGPHVDGREWDLGPGVARALGFSGVHEVRYRIIDQ